MKEALHEVGLKLNLRPSSDDSICVWDGKDLLVRYNKIDKPLLASWWRSLK